MFIVAQHTSIHLIPPRVPSEKTLYTSKRSPDITERRSEIMSGAFATVSKRLQELATLSQSLELLCCVQLACTTTFACHLPVATA